MSTPRSLSEAPQAHELVAEGNAPGERPAWFSTLKGSNQVALGRAYALQARSMRPLQSRFSQGALSGGVAPGYLIDPLRGAGVVPTSFSAACKAPLFRPPTTNSGENYGLIRPGDYHRKMPTHAVWHLFSTTRPSWS
jgi:hypothetical protein